MSNNKGKSRLDVSENIQESISSIINLRDYLKPEEETAIHRQFRSSSWKPDCQVLWSGMLREQAQIWADERDMQTLTTAMGPLMDTRTPICLYSQKSPNAWSKYIHGASAVFAWHIAKGDIVTVLCPPPPQRFHPSGLAYYQTIEEPILRAAIGDGAALRIELVHPLVHGAEDFRYQFLPSDEIETWTAAHGTTTCRVCTWRKVKGDESSAVVRTSVKHQIAAPVDSNEVDAVTSILAKTSPNCQRVISKKSKKRKVKGKKQASCASITTLAGPALSMASLHPPAPSRQGPNALKEPATGAKVVKVAKTAAAKASKKMIAAASGQAMKPAAAVAKPAPELTKAERKRAKEARKQAKQQAKEAAKVKQAKQQARKANKAAKADKALQSTVPPAKKITMNETSTQTPSTKPHSLMDDAIAAMELQYQLEFPSATRACASQPSAPAETHVLFPTAPQSHEGERKGEVGTSSNAL